MQAVDGVSFTVNRGEVVAVVGESGSGKSVTGMTLMGLTRGPNARIAGSAKLDGQELLTATNEELRKIRGNDIAMIFQDPISSLNPVYRVGWQIVEQIRTHNPQISKADATAQAVKLMERVGVPRAAERLRSYPHEFSGGMRQRVMIAMALSCSPKLLIADEPTTALDVTIQAQILDELRQLREETNAGHHPGHPRPRGCGRRRRPRRRHVLRARGRAGHARRALLRPAAPLHLGPARLDHPDRPRPRQRGCRRSPGRRRRCWRRPPAATSSRAARMHSTNATRCRRWSRGFPRRQGTSTAAG